MSTEENKAIVRKYRAAHNQNKLDALDAIVAQDLISHNALPGLPPGLAGGKLAHQGFVAAFPDGQGTTEDLFAEGDKVVERCITRGTHTGPFMGAPATGKKFEIESISIYRLANGKIVEHWGEHDGIGLMMQLGMMPAPGG
jgi:predicted ester cyclase